MPRVAKTREELLTIDRERKKASYHTDLEQKEKQKARCLARYYRKKAERLAEPQVEQAEPEPEAESTNTVSHYQDTVSLYPQV